MRAVDDIIRIDNILSCQYPHKILLLQIAVDIMRNISALSRHEKLLTLIALLACEVVQHCVDDLL